MVRAECFGKEPKLATYGNEGQFLQGSAFKMEARGWAGFLGQRGEEQPGPWLQLREPLASCDRWKVCVAGNE